MDIEGSLSEMVLTFVTYHEEPTRNLRRYIVPNDYGNLYEKNDISSNVILRKRFYVYSLNQKTKENDDSRVCMLDTSWTSYMSFL